METPPASDPTDGGYDLLGASPLCCWLICPSPRCAEATLAAIDGDTRATLDGDAFCPPGRRLGNSAEGWILFARTR
ncbi:MAG: hypothetical protein U0794_06480 [Isosphaeraceae bacterium]